MASLRCRSCVENAHFQRGIADVRMVHTVSKQAQIMFQAAPQVNKLLVTICDHHVAVRGGQSVQVVASLLRTCNVCPA
jgi:hypothetical protein